MKKILLFTIFMTVCALTQIEGLHAQDPGDRAQKFRGTWWSGVHPNLLDEKMLSLRTLDGFGVGFTSGASQSALHYAPLPRFRSLPGGDEVFPPNNDTDVLNQMIKVTEAGFMVQAYTNSENFVGNNASQFVEFADSWKNWCDTDPEAQAFINSKSYHTKSGFPDRKYMFCYAEFILKELSQEYGQYISLWQFDSAKEMESQGDDATSGNVDDQRIFEAFANAARAGNDDIAVAFNNGRSNGNFNSYPFAPATRFDDFTFGHAFGGNNNHAEKVNGNQFNLNYQHVTRMTETDGYVHDGGNWTWDDKIVGNFNSKLSTTAWSFGPNQAWEQDDFNEWNEQALLAGGMMTWSGSYNRGVTGYYDWVYTMLKATDDYLFEKGISINGEEPIIVIPETGENFNPDPTKTYYIDNLRHNLRLAATGESEDAYTTSLDNTGDDVKWQFVAKGNGSWHIQRSAGGDKPRMRTDNTADADMQEITSTDRYTYFDIQETDSGNSYFITLPDGPTNFKRLQIDNRGNVKMVVSSKDGTWESFTITEAGSVVDAGGGSGGSSSIVHMTKRNATGFAIASDSGGQNLQDVYLSSVNPSNVNQQWIEIDRGGGYYSYQKQGTDFCIDGGRGGANRQKAYLYACGENNQNQHWQKVDAGDGAFKLIKRNALDFALDGGRGGVNGQTLGLYNSANTSQNLQWFITPVSFSATALSAVIQNEAISISPNPVASELTVRGLEGADIEIYDLNGRAVMNKADVADIETLDMSELRAGMYVVEVRMGDETKKIVKL